MRRTIILLLTIVLVTIARVRAQPIEFYIKVTNQYGECITEKVHVVVLGGIVEPYNTTHYRVRTNRTEVLVRVYRLGICVGEFTLDTGKDWMLRVLVSDMVVEAPRGVTLKITLVGTNFTWILTGEPSYVLEDMPHAVYRFEVLGTPFSNTIYWEGGVVSIGKREYRVDLTYLPLLAIPPSLVGAYQLYKRRRRRRAPLVTTSTTPQLQPAVVPQPVAQSEEVVPGSMPRVPTPPQAKGVVRIPSGGGDRVEVREEVRRRRPTKFRSIADVLIKTRVEE